MKKITFLLVALMLGVNACALPTLQQPIATNPPAPNLDATAAVLSQLTLDAQPSETSQPSNTPEISTPTETPTQATATETQNSVLLTLTATLGTGTVTANDGSATPGTPGSPTVTVTGTVPSTQTPTIVSISNGLTPTETAHPLYYGTLPPYIPFGHIELTNKSKTDVYISMRCVTKEGYITIIEYPVESYVNAKGPIGQYTYVVWVGGRKIDGSFSLKGGRDLSIIIYKDRVTIK